MIVVGFIPAKEEWIPLWLQVPHITVGSDGMPAVNKQGDTLGWDDPFDSFASHPRTSGAQAKVLRLSREQG